ncbi:group II intron reverse transcriptase/maturase [Desulfitibacter alkalitolerans]|uniref:group II intron reverse transcriptase/maturase n=1 Tax=Desulfitibacter alkalitolerans TaxID=264641 RepID=UPI0004830C7B|nr:group II intron reverse transcriptase/maturase [Desulfitibacter alkalitolerans]
MNKTKPFRIPKQIVQEAYEKVKANKGSAGIDEVSLKEFEKDLKNNLYKIWNRMSSGTYFPPAVKAVDIPKKNGGIRVLGIPTVADRIAQMVVKIHFEPKVEPYFLEDSYGYRPNKSAIEAVGITRQRCWEYDWVLEFDIKGLFDNIDHELLMKAVHKHTKEKWEILYIERWLKAPFQKADGTEIKRDSGTPQGGVISPILANLFMHYAFDKWMKINYPNNPWARYADDGVVHCSTLEETENILETLTARFKNIGLELHPDKTRIVYCKDDNRKGSHTQEKFDFLGYTFRSRLAKNRRGEYFITFSPAISNKASKAIKQNVRNMNLQFRTNREINDLADLLNPKIRGWINYYGSFCKSELTPVLKYINKTLQKWVRRKYKNINGSKARARRWLIKVAEAVPQLFVHWKLGIIND